MGPFSHPSINKARYVLIFVDDFSRFTWIYFLEKKTELFQHLKDFKALVETQSEKKIKILRTDNGGEYVNHQIQNLFHEAGIQLYHMVPYTPHKNGVAEWKNRSLKRWHLSCYMQIHFHKDYGPKHLIMKPTSKTDVSIGLSRIRPPMMLGVASYWK
jgi:transposase InsO family protein